jgi:hypothetical protein
VILELSQIPEVDKEYLEMLICGAGEGWIRSFGASV